MAHGVLPPSVPRPALFKDFTNWLGAVFSFNLSFVAHPECSAKLTHLAKWAMFLCTPLAFISCFGAWYGVHAARARFYSWYIRRHGASLDLPRAQKKEEERRRSKLVVVRANCLRASVQLVFLMYIFVVQQSAQAFDCSFVEGAEDAPPVLDSNPSVRCEFDDPQWPAMLSIGGIVFFVVGLLLPWRLQRTLRALRDEPEKYNDPHNQALYGWMLRKYSGDRYYWEIIVCWRKLAISIVFLLSTKYPAFQVFASLVIVLISLFFSIYRRPFRCAKCQHELDDNLYDLQTAREMEESAKAGEEGQAAGTSTTKQEEKKEKKEQQKGKKTSAGKKSEPQAGRRRGRARVGSVVTQQQIALHGAAAIAHQKRTYRGREVTCDVVGRQWWLLLLAQADLRKECHHFGAPVDDCRCVHYRRRCPNAHSHVPHSSTGSTSSMRPCCRQSCSS